MKAWYCQNYEEKTTYPFYHLRSTPIYIDDVANPVIPAHILNLQRRVNSTFVAFGIRDEAKNKDHAQVVFLIRNDKFADLFTQACVMPQDERQQRNFLRHLFHEEEDHFLRTAWISFERTITHLRWTKPFVDLSITSVIVPDLMTSFPYIVMDSQELFEEDTLPICKYDFVAYKHDSLLPSKFRTFPLGRLSYYQAKRDLDIFLETENIVENETILTWVAPSEFKTTELKELYKTTFRLQARDIPGAPQSFRDFLEAPSLPELDRNKEEFFIYHTRFNTKYRFLFAWSQYWRLRHWVSL